MKQGAVANMQENYSKSLKEGDKENKMPNKTFNAPMGTNCSLKPVRPLQIWNPPDQYFLSTHKPVSKLF